ncbi:MAG: hypothetical protein ABJF01_01570 [bacterium]
MTATAEVPATRQTIEPRTPTSEPLVEQCSNGSLAPTGRRLTFEVRSDGLNAYGLADAESTAYWCALARVNNDHASLSILVTTEESREIQIARDAAPPGTFDAAVFLAKYRTAHPLPTSFAPLPDGDPSSNYASTTSETTTQSGAETSASDSTTAVVDAPAVPVPPMPPVQVTPAASSSASLPPIAPIAAANPVSQPPQATATPSPNAVEAPHPQAQGILKAVTALRKDLSVAHWALDFLEQVAAAKKP